MRLPLWCGLGGLCLGAAVASAQEAEDWLERMAKANRSYVYNATVVFVAGPDMTALRVSQVIEEGRVRQHAINLTGPPQTIVAGAGIAQRSAAADSPPEYLETPLAVDVPVRANSSAIRANYRVSVGPQDQVAGRPVRRLDFIPLDTLRYQRRAWLDVETGLPLRSAVIDGQIVLEQMLFTDVQFSSTALEPEEIDPRPSDKRDWPGTWPQGFELRALVGGSDRRQWVFTDGLAVVSIFAESGDPADYPSLHPTGATDAITRDVDGLRWTAIGDVPRATLEAFLAPAGN